MKIYKKIRHLILLYFDLKEHKKRNRILGFEIRWNSYDVFIQEEVYNIYGVNAYQHYFTSKKISYEIKDLI